MRELQTRGSRGGWLAAAWVLSVLTGPQARAAVVAVSPGERGREVEAASACPTYSWSAAAGATAYELAVFRIEGAEEPELLFTRRVEGSATSWSPSRAECLAAGGSYGWTVRPLAAEGGNEAAAWAEPLRFRVAGAPSEEEVAMALAVLERWGRTRPGGAGAAAAASPPSAPPTRPARRSAARGDLGTLEAPIATGVAAIRGENPDASGSAFGLFGISHSPAGAGVVARNESAGADLVLDGEGNGATDTLLRQDSLDRPSANPESFDFRNSGSGALTLKVDGVDVVTTATDQDSLGALSCPAGTIVRRNAAGTAWECGGDADTLAGLACGIGQIAEVGPGGSWVCAADDDSLATLACPDGQIAKRITGAWACAPDDTGTAGIWSTYPEGPDVRVVNAQGQRVAIGTRAIQPVGSYPTEDGALTVSHREALPLTAQYNLTMDGRSLQARLAPDLFSPQQDAPLRINPYGGGISIGKDAPPTRAALEAQGSIGNTMAMFQRGPGGQGLALVGDWPGLYANGYWNNGVQTMSGSGYTQLLNFDQASGDIVLQTSSAPNTAPDVPAATLEERLRLRKDGALLSSLTQNQFSMAPVAVISLEYSFSVSGGTVNITEDRKVIRSVFPVTVQVSAGELTLEDDFVTISIDVPGTGYVELLPVIATNSLYETTFQYVSSTGSQIGIDYRVGGINGRTVDLSLIVYGMN